MPRFLPCCPPHLSSSIESKPRRFDRAVKEQDLFHTALVQSREQFSLDEKPYQITIIEDLISNVKLLNLPSKWIVWSSDNMSLHFVKPSITDHLISIRCSLTVTETLHIIGVYGGTKLTLSRSKIKDLREVDSLLKEIDQYSPSATLPDTKTAQQQVKEATLCVRQAINLLSPPEEDSSEHQPIYLRLQFILCQLENALLPKNCRRYNVNTLVLALKCQLISPVCVYTLLSLYNPWIASPFHIILPLNVYIPVLEWIMNLQTI